MADPEQKIRIHNMGIKKGDKFTARKIIFPAGWDDDNQPLRSEDGKKIINDTILPNQHKSVTYRQFKFLKDQFRDEIINIDDITELQRQFEEKKPEPEPKAAAIPEGYVSKAKMDEAVELAVASALARARADKIDGKADGDKKIGMADDTPSAEDLILQLDGMDKSELIAFVEKNILEVDARKYKKIDDFKSAILTAMQNQKAAASSLSVDNSGANQEDAV